MSTSIEVMSPQFRVVIAKATALLASMSKRLPRIADNVDNLYDESDLLYLGSTALLAGCRGCNLVDIDEDVAEDLGLDDLAGIESDDFLDQLVILHDLLIGPASESDSFAVLEFVNDVGQLCYGLRRYVERH